MKLEAFKQSVLPIKNKLYRFALRMVGDPAEAQDVVQEVFIKTWQHREKLDEITNIEAWCMRLTRNLCIDKIRSKHRRTDTLDETWNAADTSANPQQQAETQDAISFVRQLMEELPENQKLVMQLRDIEELSYQEISEQLDMPMGQVKVNLFRARKKIREKLIQTQAYGLQRH